MKRIPVPKRVHYRPAKPEITFFTQGRSAESIKRAATFSAGARAAKLGVKRNPNFL